jgi:hypothetical protein
MKSRPTSLYDYTLSQWDKIHLAVHGLYSLVSLIGKMHSIIHII